MTRERGKREREDKYKKQRANTGVVGDNNDRQGEEEKSSVWGDFGCYGVEGGQEETRGVEKWKPAALLHDYTENIICIRE